MQKIIFLILLIGVMGGCLSTDDTQEKKIKTEEYKVLDRLSNFKKIIQSINIQQKKTSVKKAEYIGMQYTVKEGVYVTTESVIKFYPLSSIFSMNDEQLLKILDEFDLVKNAADKKSNFVFDNRTLYYKELEQGINDFYSVQSLAAADVFPAELYIYPVSDNGLGTPQAPDGVAPRLEKPLLTSSQGSILVSPQIIKVLNISTGSTIFYTTNSAIPTTASNLYISSTGITITTSTTILAIAVKAGYSNSIVSKETYSVMTKIPNILANVVPGIYTTAQSITMTCTTSGVEIRYTTDLSEPTKTSLLYSVPLLITTSTTIKIKAFKTGFIDSDTSNFMYTITGKTAVPILPVSASYIGYVNVTIPVVSGTKVRYTNNTYTPSQTVGVELTTTTTIKITSTTTIKAIAYRAGWLDSDVASATYTILEKLGSPTFSSLTGTFTTAQTLKITTTSSGAEIRYTIDGTEPSKTSILYTTGISISTTRTIKAKCFKSGYGDSDTSAVTITIASGHVDGEVQKYLSSSKTNGVNIVFLGDGFIKADLVSGGAYEATAKQTIDYILSREPFSSYKEYFNAYIIYAESVERGADTSPEINDKNTIFNGTKNLDGVARLFAVQDTNKVYQYIEKAIPQSKANIILACMNDTEYGGSGGDIAAFSTNSDSQYIALHEIGHMFANLADEYADASIEAYWPVEYVVDYPNVDTTGDLTKVKWKEFIGNSKYSATGAFEGGYYRSSGIWRPAVTSIMKALYYDYFNAPSRQAIVKKILSISNETYSAANFFSKDKVEDIYVGSIKRGNTGIKDEMIKALEHKFVFKKPKSKFEN